NRYRLRSPRRRCLRYSEDPGLRSTSDTGVSAGPESLATRLTSRSIKLHRYERRSQFFRIDRRDQVVQVVEVLESLHVLRRNLSVFAHARRRGQEAVAGVTQ